MGQEAKAPRGVRRRRWPFGWLSSLLCCLALTAPADDHSGDADVGVQFGWRPTYLHSAKFRRDGQDLARRKTDRLVSHNFAAHLRLRAGSFSLPIGIHGDLQVDTGWTVDASFERFDGWLFNGRNASIERRELTMSYGLMPLDTGTTNFGVYKVLVLSAELFQMRIQVAGGERTENGAALLVEPIGWRSFHRLATWVPDALHVGWGSAGSVRLGGGIWSSQTLGQWDCRLELSAGLYGDRLHWSFNLGLSLGGYRYHTTGEKANLMQSAWATGLFASFVARL